MTESFKLNFQKNFVLFRQAQRICATILKTGARLKRNIREKEQVKEKANNKAEGSQ